MIGDKYISLREAAKLTGYSRDYVGYLIRSGKIQGQKTVGSSAWLVSEETILQYAMENKAGRIAARSGREIRRSATSGASVIRGQGLSLSFTSIFEKLVLFLVIALIGFSVYLFYAFSAMSDRQEDVGLNDSAVDVVGLDVNEDKKIVAINHE